MSCINGQCGATQTLDLSQKISTSPQKLGLLQGEAMNGHGATVTKSCANGTCGGGASGGSKLSFKRAGGCSNGQCGGSSTVSKPASGCSTGQCGGATKSANAEGGKRKGLFGRIIDAFKSLFRRK